MDTKIVATVHDSIEIISPKSETDEVLKLLHNEMTEYPYIRNRFGINFNVPLEIDVLVGPSFGVGEKVKF